MCHASAEEAWALVRGGLSDGDEDVAVPELPDRPLKGVIIPVRLLSWAFSVDGEAVGAAWRGTR